MNKGMVCRHWRTDPVEPLIGREHSGTREREHAAAASEELRSRIEKMFWRFEVRYGLDKGEGRQLLLNEGVRL